MSSAVLALCDTCVNRPCWLLVLEKLDRKHTVSPTVSPFSNVCKRTNPPFLAPVVRFFNNRAGSVLREPQAWLHNTKSAPPATLAGSGPLRGSHCAEVTASSSRVAWWWVKRSKLVAVAV